MMEIEEPIICAEDMFCSFATVNDSRALIQSSNNDLVCLCINLRSLRKNWDAMVSTLHSILSYLDLLVFVEINVNYNEGKLFNIPGFNSELRCRQSGVGGGILVLYRSVMKVEKIEYDFLSSELLLLNICYKNEKFLMAVFYRPPSLNINQFNAELDDFLSSEIVESQINMLMLGDMNICYRSGVYGSANYLDVLYSHGLYNSIQGPTRSEFLNNRLVESCIDHVNPRFPRFKHKSFVIENKLADHYWIGIAIDFNKRNSSINNMISKEIISSLKVNEGIQSQNWWPILDMREPTDIYNTLVAKLNRIYDSSKIEIKMNQTKIFNPWFNDEIDKLIKEKERLWQLVKRDRSNINLKKSFKEIRNKLCDKIRCTKRKYYFNMFSATSGDIRKTWALVDEFTNKKSRKSVFENIKESFKLESQRDFISTTQLFSQSFINTVESINAELRGEHFNLDESTESRLFSPGDKVSMNFLKMDEKTLLSIINGLNTKSSAGPDNVRPKDIKNNIFSLKLVILHLINRIIFTGVIPTPMKVTYLRPIYKNGSKSDPNNYRPIGSVSVIMKILEYYICNQLNRYLQSHNIISDTQYGFRQKRSTIDLLAVLTNKINKALNENKFVVAVTTDLSRAFDLVNHGILLDKLKALGVGGRLFNVFLNYFQNRTTRVGIGSFVGPEIHQTCGLIQGSVMAPTLFNIYVNDFANLRFKGNILQFADDNIIYSIHTNLNTAIINLQHDLDLAVKYFFNNSIKVNSKKTKAIIFKSPRKQIHNVIALFCHSHTCFRITHQCQCNQLSYENKIKHLGVFLDTDMKFNSHITYLSNVMRITMYKIYKMSDVFPIPIKRIIYFSLIQSIISYGIILYYTAPEHLLKPLKSVLTRLIKVLFNDLPTNLLGIMSFEALAKYTDLLKNYFDNSFRRTLDTRYNLRTTSFIVESHFNNYGKLLPEYRIPVLLNSLPSELKNLPTYVKVKKQLKIYFLNTT
jgi:hypothetical protein